MRTSLVSLIIAATSGIGVGENLQVRPDESLVQATLAALIKEERTDRICALVTDGKKSGNMTPTTYDTLGKKHRHFCECAASDCTFVVGPVGRGESGRLELQVRRVSAH